MKIFGIMERKEHTMEEAYSIDEKMRDNLNNPEPYNEYVTVSNVQVGCCGKCPNNREYPNPMLSILPPTHRCLAAWDNSSPYGRLIFNPNIIPDWCPVR